jgi:hypothetical protein
MALPKPDMNEVVRRYASTYSAPQETAPTTPAPGKARELKDPQHAVALINIAHQGRNPRHERAAIRILGFFPNAEAAAQRSAELVAHDPTCALAVVDTCSWYLATRQQELGKAGADAAGAKLMRLFELHRKSRVDRKVEFEQHRNSMRGDRKPKYQQNAVNPCEQDVDVPSDRGTEAAGVPPPAPTTAVSAEGEEPAQACDGGAGAAETKAGEQRPVKTLPMTLEQRGLKSAVIAVMNDYEVAGGGSHPDSEMAFIVFDGFESDDKATQYVEHTAKRAIQDHDIAVVAMYEWLHPELRESEGVVQVERNAELNRIMAARRSRDAEVHTFKSMCSELKVDIPYRDVYPDLGEDHQPVHPDAAMQAGTSTIPISYTDTTENAKITSSS